jgi:hypothetical protein
MAIIALLAGLLLSGTAAYYSIIGLIAIFPGALFAISLMGSSLEFAKLVAASWLYRNWSIAPKFLRVYFIFAVFILMLITSLGIFGFLSKVHLESSIGVASNSIQISTIEQQINSEQRILDNAQRSLESLDVVVSNSFMDGARIRNQQRNERTQINNTIQETSTKIVELNSILEPLRRANIESEAKIGPLKYVAELIYGKEEAKNYFDSAVRAVIILIVLVFDPLAVLLLIAANISWMHKKQNTTEEKQEKKKVAKKFKDGYNSKSIKDSIYNFMMRDDFGITHTDKVEENEPTRKAKEK